MPTTRQALFQSMGDDVLTQLLATMSFADRSAINSVCKRWRKVVASPGFIQARRSVGETGLVILGYALYRFDPHPSGNGLSRVLDSTPAFIIADGDRVLRGPGISSWGLRCAVLGREVARWN